jgi:hypothetical protein
VGDGFGVGHGVILKEAGGEERMQGESVSTKQISTPMARPPRVHCLTTSATPMMNSPAAGVASSTVPLRAK